MAALARALLLSIALTPAHAAFTLPIASGNDTIDRNAAGTWCFYPAANASAQAAPLDLSCGNTAGAAGASPAKADLELAMQAHLSQRPVDSLSVAYYSAAGVRLGGPEFVVAQTTGKVVLCASGQRDLLDAKPGVAPQGADAERYVTLCEVAERDNAFGLWDAEGQRRENKTVCAVGVGQRNVTDGCYVPMGMTLTWAAASASDDAKLSNAGAPLAPLPVSSAWTLLAFVSGLWALA